MNTAGGTKVVDQLVADLRREFPDIKGLSLRNLRYMRSFAETWPDQPILQEVLAKLTWYHNITLIEKVPITGQRLWYARKTIEHGWSRNILVIQIETKLYERQGNAVTNFTRALPAPQSDLAQESLKDPYKFDYLSLGNEARERDIENALVHHISRLSVDWSNLHFLSRSSILANGP